MKSIKFICLLISLIILFFSATNCKKETIQTIIKDTTVIYRDTIVIKTRDTINIVKIDTGSTVDKKVNLCLFENSAGSTNGYSSYIFSTPQTDFLVSDYSKIDSIAFVVNDLEIYSFSTGKIITSKTLTIELMDLTNNTPIKNGKIVSSGISKNVYVSTVNIINNFPSTPINLGIKVTFDNTGNDYWALKHAKLVLVRKKL